MSSRIWTNDTRRDEDKKKSPRAEATAARQQAPSNPGQTRACFTGVQTEDRPAWPPQSPSPRPRTQPRSTFLQSRMHRLCTYKIMYVM